MQRLRAFGRLEKVVDARNVRLALMIVAYWYSVDVIIEATLVSTIGKLVCATWT
jgi:hypothetical protein